MLSCLRLCASIQSFMLDTLSSANLMRHWLPPRLCAALRTLRLVCAKECSRWGYSYHIHLHCCRPYCSKRHQIHPLGCKEKKYNLGEEVHLTVATTVQNWPCMAIGPQLILSDPALLVLLGYRGFLSPSFTALLLGRHLYFLILQGPILLRIIRTHS